MKQHTPARIERVWFLDAIRYWVVMLVVVFHAWLSQVEFDGTWPVDDPRKLYFAKCLVFIVYPFMMPVLFFIAGYFALPSLESKGSRGFLRAKVKRLLLPAALILVFFNPVDRYLFHLTRSFEAGIPKMRYLEFWGEFFRQANWFETGGYSVLECTPLHLWFVGVLFLLFTAVAALSSLGKLQTDNEAQSPPASIGSILRPLILGTATVWLCGVAIFVLIGGEMWVKIASLLLFEAPFIVLHILYFCLGVLAYRCRWFTTPEIVGAPWPWLALWCLTGTIQIITCTWFYGDEELMTSAIAYSLCWATTIIHCPISLMLLWSLGVRYANDPSPIHQHLAANSYRIYLLHYVIMGLIQYQFYRWSTLSPWMVLIGASLSSLVLSYVAAVAVGRLTIAISSARFVPRPSVETA